MTNKQIIIVFAILFCLGVVCIVLSGGSEDAAYAVHEQVLENHENGNNVLVKYPQIEGDEYSAVNDLIAQGIGQYLYDSYGQQIADLSLEMDYRIVRKNEELFSVLWEGVGYVAQAAHPNNHLFAMTLDLSQKTRLTLSDFYDLNDGFVRTLKEHLLAQNKEVGEIFSNYTDEELFLLLANADQAGQAVFSYVTGNAAGISLPIAHAAGDHVETEMKFTALREFEKRKPD